MWRAARISTAVGLCAVTAVANAATVDWMEKVETDLHNLPQIENWINSACKPDSIDDIKVVSYQNGPGGPLSVHVYCRQGEAKLKPVVYDFWRFDGDDPPLDLFARNVLIGGNPIILIRYKGEGNLSGVYFLH